MWNIFDILEHNIFGTFLKRHALLTIIEKCLYFGNKLPKEITDSAKISEIGSILAEIWIVVTTMTTTSE